MSEQAFDPTVNPTGDELLAYEQELFAKIRYTDLALMRVTLDGVPRAAVCQVGTFADGDRWVSPLAIIALPEEITKMVDPEGDSPRPFTEDELAEGRLEEDDNV